MEIMRLSIIIYSNFRYSKRVIINYEKRNYNFINVSG